MGKSITRSWWLRIPYLTGIAQAQVMKKSGVAHTPLIGLDHLAYIAPSCSPVNFTTFLFIRRLGKPMSYLPIPLKYSRSFASRQRISLSPSICYASGYLRRSFLKCFYVRVCIIFLALEKIPGVLLIRGSWALFPVIAWIIAPDHLCYHPQCTVEKIRFIGPA